MVLGKGGRINMSITYNIHLHPTRKSGATPVAFDWVQYVVA
jgi:hypothetical protein